MKRELILTHEPINERALMTRRALTGKAGAVVYFAGIVRDTEGKIKIQALEYEAFEKMAVHQFNLLFEQMARRWPVESVRAVHRLGTVKVNEPSLWLEVVAAHRGEALEACEWLITEMKRVVPIWKKPI